MFGRLKRKTVMNIVRHGIFLLVLYTLQAAVFPWFGKGGIPVLLAVAVVGVSLFEDREDGAVFGLFAGILCDIAMGKPLIVFTVTLTVVGYLSGYLGETLLSRRFPSYMLCCFVTMVIVSFIQLFSLLFFYGESPGRLLITAAVQTGTSLICAVPVYPIVKWLARRSGKAF